MTIDARIVAVLLSLSLTLRVMSADESTDDSQQEMDVIFPEDEFSRFIDCLYLGDSPECIVYVTVGEFNSSVVGVAENWSRDEKPKPCKYFTCDSNITSSDGELFCQEQEKSTVCNKRLERQFWREPVKIWRDPTCAVMFLSEAVDIFGFEELSSFESCSASCLCETPVATTHAKVSDTDTTTVRSVSKDTENTTAAYLTQVTSISGHSIENESINTTVATATTVVVVVGATATTGSSTEQSVLQNLTTETSGSTNKSSGPNQTVEDAGDNDTLKGNNTEDITTAGRTAIIAVAILATIGFIGLMVIGGLYWRRRFTARQSTDHDPHDMVVMDNLTLPTNSRRQSHADTGKDPETDHPFLCAERDAQP